MGAGSWWHWAIVIAVVLILFGGKKIPELMKGIGTGIKGFKKAIKDDGEDTEFSSVANTSGQTIIEASTSQPQISQSTKGRGRPKGSKNKNTISKVAKTAKIATSKDSTQNHNNQTESPKKRGRPKKA